MFGDLLGNMEEKQKQMQEKLKDIHVSGESGNGAVKVVANANQQIINISVSKEIIDPDDPEQLEDLLMVAVNRALEQAAEKAGIESQKMINDMMPPGLGGLGGLFGQ
ncbi:MAG: YbaB/EbfC family nucleoid-associated protein [Bacteroidota bacterium]